jgi:hypothetical protein
MAQVDPVAVWVGEQVLAAGHDQDLELLRALMSPEEHVAVWVAIEQTRAQAKEATA